MTKKIMVFMALALALSPVLVGAQETSVKTNVDIQAKIGDKASTTMAAKIQMRQEKVRAHADELFSRLDHVDAVLVNLIIRVNSRIAKLEAAGKDTTTVKASIASAQQLIDQAKASIDALKLQVETAASSSTPLKAFQPVRTAIQNTIKNIRQAHQKIVEAITGIAHLEGNVGVTATSTASSTSQ